jgi:hypothetical protein
MAEARMNEMAHRPNVQDLVWSEAFVKRKTINVQPGDVVDLGLCLQVNAVPEDPNKEILGANMGV